ncbi:DUF4349 domain-containing protein [Pontibacter sp. G13]|uniref:DUF4349 domain-containing protein n=1 Tax=Pontibacter sp. G13 TaxID=3074898 RepID=UPI00288A3C4B|nr:DUF4349 domain-containing protein [Pontibacter sp. G13]WNJ17283.1 DUF4349 domain-containing protein [Pontibacter sp. G13]
MNLSRFFPIALCIMLLSAAACQQADQQAEAYLAGDVDFEQAVPPPPKARAASSTEIRKLIKQGELEFATEDLVGTRTMILKATQAVDGYVAEDRSWQSGYRSSQALIVKVPAERFDELMAAIDHGVGEFDRRSVNVKDVTTSYFDLEGRLRAKREMEARYLKLLKQANTVEDMLKIEEQIGELRADIESFEGNFRHLKHQVELATINITFYQKSKEESNDEPGFGAEFVESISAGWNGVVTTFLALLRIWPLLIVIAFITWLVVRYRRKK